jgi:hypothetical protein
MKKPAVAPDQDRTYNQDIKTCCHTYMESADQLKNNSYSESQFAKDLENAVTSLNLMEPERIKDIGCFSETTLVESQRFIFWHLGEYKYI